MQTRLFHWRFHLCCAATGALAGAVLAPALTRAQAPLKVHERVPRAAMQSRPTIAPRSYTTASFRARLSSLPNGAAMLAQSAVGGPQRTRATAGTAANTAAPQASGGWSTGVGAVGGVSTVSVQNPYFDDGHGGGVYFSGWNVDFDNRTIWFNTGSQIWAEMYAPSSASGPVTFVVLFDFDASDVFPGRGMAAIVNGTLTNNPPSTCTYDALHASIRDGVATCAVMFSAVFPGSEPQVILTPTGAAGIRLVDVSFMRLR